MRNGLPLIAEILLANGASFAQETNGVPQTTTAKFSCVLKSAFGNRSIVCGRIRGYITGQLTAKI